MDHSAMTASSMPGDPRFFRRTGPHTLAAVVDAAEAEAPPRRLMLHGVAPLRAATQDEVSFFLDRRKLADALANTRAGAVIVHPDMAARVPAGSVAIVSNEPNVAWAKVAALFHPLPPPVAGIHSSAVVAPDARLGERVCVYPGARIGQDGFGFAITLAGFHSVPQLGRVIVEDDVEIGANTTIDRGALDDTVIGAGSRLDNLVQIGHNVRLGRGCVVVAQAGISGSSVLEDYVMLGGQSGLTGHVRIGKQARIGAQAGVIADVPAGADMVGSPAQPVKSFFREVAILRRLVRDREIGKRSKEPG